MNNTRGSEPVRGKSMTYFNYPLAFFLCVGAGAVVLLAVWLLGMLTDISVKSLLLLASVLYVIAVAAIVAGLAVSRRSATRREILIHRFDKMLDNMVFPYIITNADGILIKNNHAADKMFEHRSLKPLKNISELLPFLSAETIKKSSNARVELQWRFEKDGTDNVRYLIIESTETVIGDYKKPADIGKGAYYLTTIIDITEEKNRQIGALRRLETETMAVGRAEIDDLKAFSNSSGVPEKDAAEKIRDLLSKWTAELDGLIYEPETRKFIILLPLISLNKCVREKFPILDTIRDAVSTKDDELTVSMGFSVTGETLAARMANADIAFEGRRSGNKAVVNTGGELVFYGKDRRRQVSRGSTEYRRIGNTLRRYFAECGSVLIMGHSRPDYDSIGSCIGIAKLAAEYGKDRHIVISDTSDANFDKLTEEIRLGKDYEGCFINEEKALSLAGSDTLLIITDVNNLTTMESPSLYRTIRETTGGKIAVIDHHEKNENTVGSDFEYIDASCSSACEIIAGVLDLGLNKTRLTSEEATILLAGIMLDTKNFTQYATRKTYAAAEYLSQCSASADKARKFFEADYETFGAEYSLGASLSLCHEGRIAFCVGEGLPDESKTKIVIGRVADRLLTLEGVLASIVIAEFDGRINASARSNNNIVNCASLFAGVGGGNFNNAGARATDISLAEFRKILKRNTDDFFENNIDGADASEENTDEEESGLI